MCALLECTKARAPEFVPTGAAGEPWKPSLTLAWSNIWASPTSASLRRVSDPGGTSGCGSQKENSQQGAAVEQIDPMGVALHLDQTCTMMLGHLSCCKRVHVNE